MKAYKDTILLIGIIFAVGSLRLSLGWKIHDKVTIPNCVNTATRSFLASVLLSFTFESAVIADGFDLQSPDLLTQLDSVRNEQNNKYASDLMQQRQLDSSRGNDYVSKSQVAKAVLILPANNGDSRMITSSEYPLGFPDIGGIDSSYQDPTKVEESALICTSVGRTGSPVAAKKVKLNTLKFPAFIELTTDNLLFPYTKEAWLKSDLSMQDISITCIMDVDGQLVTSEASQRYGYGISDVIRVDTNGDEVDLLPEVKDSKIIRKDAVISLGLQGKDSYEYTKEELQVLQNLDAVL